MTSRAYERKAEVPPKTKAPFDRVPDLYERAKIRRLFKAGMASVEIGAQLRLRYGHVETILREGLRE
jgi:hypothetical protein